MPLYYYRAFDNKSKKISGTIEAGSDREAKSILREQGVMVTSIEVKKSTASKENLKGDNLLAFTVQLSQLVSAGVPLYESLVVIEEQYRKEPFHRVMLSLSEQIKKGVTLSDAMSYYPESFGKLYVSMVKAGESVGALDIVLKKLGELLSKQSRLQKQITTAMIYPAMLGGFCLVVICVLLGFVVPSIEGIFAGRKLNTFTNIILSVSHLFIAYWWLGLIIIVAGSIWGYMKIKSPEGRIFIEKISLKIPYIRTLVINTAVARFCRTMGTLLSGGLPMIDALRISRGVMRNHTLENEMEKAEGRIIEGSSLSTELSRSNYMPIMVSRMLAVGEDSGTTTVMFNEIADMYEEEIQKSIDRLMALMQPVILIFMGGIIGMVILAILLPLTDLESIGLK